MLDGQGRPRIHLNVLTYFLFWTAFYVLRVSHISATSAATRPVRTLSLTPAFGSVKKVGCPAVLSATLLKATEIDEEQRDAVKCILPEGCLQCSRLPDASWYCSHSAQHDMLSPAENQNIHIPFLWVTFIATAGCVTLHVAPCRS